MRIHSSKICKIALVLLAFAILISGCPSQDAALPAFRNQGSNILRYDVPYSFGPFVAGPEGPYIQAGSSHVMPFVFSYLAVPDQDENLQPDLADKWTYDENTFGWIFDLRKDARFHDGKPVTAQDAAFSLKTILGPDSSDVLAGIRSIEALSDTRLRVCLFQNNPEFLKKISGIEILQSPQNPSRPPEEFLIGSGPFKLKEKSADRIVLEANAGYYRGRPSIDGMVFTFVPDQEKLWTKLMGGQSDVAAEITPENVPITEACSDLFYMNRHSLPFYTMLLFNTQDPLFSDSRVRYALTLAINREDIVQKILHGNGVIAPGPMGLDPNYHNPKIAPVPYDPPKALELLTKAGWQYDSKGRFLVKDGKFFEFTVFVAEELPTHQQVARYLRLCFNDIGIRLYVRPMPMEKLIQSYYGGTDFQAVLTESCGGHRTLDHLKRVWCGADAAGSKCGGVKDARLAALFEALEAQKDPGAQKDLFYAIEARILDLSPAAFLYHETVCDIMSKRFDLPSPFYIFPNRGWNLQFASLKKGASNH